MKNDKGGSHEDDAAALLAAVAAGIAEVGSNPDADALAALKLAIDGDPLLQFTVIRQTRVTWWDWLNRPCHAKRVACFNARYEALQKASLNDELTRSELLGAFRAAMMVRYGVAVDHQSFRILRGLIVDRRISERRLKWLLSFPTIWWGTSFKPRAEDGIATRTIKRLWAMGRPQTGELAIARFHRLTRWASGLMLVAAMSAFSLMIGGAIATLMRRGLTWDVAAYSWSAMQFALLAAGLTWLGPGADKAARYLMDRLPPK